MADPLSIASGAAGLVGLTIQATQLACRYVAEVSRAGETVLECLRSLSLLRDVLVRIEETSADGELAAIITRKSQLIPPGDVERCEQSIEKVRVRLAALFHDDGKIKRRHALAWPFKSNESKDLIEQLQRFRDTFAAVMVADSLDVSVRLHRVAVETRSDVRDIKDEMAGGRRDRASQALVDWILPEDMETWRLGSDRANSHQWTGNWFLESDAFLDWMEPRGSKRGILWCVGAPGSGKSVLMSRAITHIQDRPPQMPGSPPAPAVLSHFCDHRDTRTQSPDVIIRHLMRQAALQSDTVLDKLQMCTELQDARKSGRSLRLEDLSRIFLDTCLLSDGHFLVVLDGLDECAEDLDGLEARQEVLQLITKAESRGTRILTASRDLADIRAELSGCCSELKVRAPDADLRLYVTARLHGIEKRVPQAKSLKGSIVDKVVNDAYGIFLLARLMMDMVAPSSINNVRQIKKFLGESRCDLTKMYRETLARIMSNNAASGDLARKMLLWLCYAGRPLREPEIQHALATEMEDDDFDPDGITPGELLQACCMGVVVCDSEGIYSLFHQTAYDFFRSSPELSSAAAHLLISNTCLRYLSFSTTRAEGPCRDLDALEERRERLALLDYAAKHWADHARQVEDDIVDSIVSFITDDVLRQCLAQVFYHRKRDDGKLKQMMFDSLPTGSTALEVACGRGLLLTAKKLLIEDMDVSSLAQADDQGWTPLISASSYGRVEVIDLLLDHAASISPSGEDAGEKSTEDDAKEKADTGDDDGEDAYAENSDAENSDTEDNETEKKYDVIGLDKADEAGWTPLFWAIVKGQKSAAERLLAAGASASLRDGSSWTPIDWAAFRGDRSLVTLLLQYTTLPRDYHWRDKGMYQPREFSPIFLAAAAGDRQTVESLLEHGSAPHESTGKPAKGIFRAMSKVEHFYRFNDYKRHRMVSIPSVMMTESFTIRLFEAAIRSDQLDIVKMLVELGSTLGAVEGELKDRSALHIAACCGKKRICEYLITKGSDGLLQDKTGHTPLDLALLVGAVPCVKLFLEHLARNANVTSSLMKNGNAPAALVFGWHDVARRRRRLRRHPAGDRHSLIPQVRQDTSYMLQEPSRSSASRNPLLYNATLKDATTSTADEDEDGGEMGEDAVIEVLRSLLDHGCDVNSTEEDDNQTALHYACKLSKPKLVSFLLDNGADVNAIGRWGETCLYMACDADVVSFDVVRILVQSGAEINRLTQFQRSPLLEACRQAPAEVVQFLIASGAEVNVYDNLERHPLHMACCRSLSDPATRDGTLALIQQILALSDADILSRTCSWSDKGVQSARPTALSFAIGAENWAAAEFLRARGATAVDIDHISTDLWDHATDPRGEKFRRLVRDFGADPAAKAHTVGIITHCLLTYQEGKRAASDGFEDNVAALIEAGADIDGGGQHSDETALQKACQVGMDLEFVRILLRHGADATKGSGWWDGARERYEEAAASLPPP